ncbi:MAG: TRAP transporter small permease [bacterium]
MDMLKTKIRKLSYGACFVGMLFSLPLMFLTVLDVAGRAFLGKPMPGSFELSEYMLSVLILLGAAYTQQVKGHVGVDFLTKRLSPKLQALCGALTTSACLFIVSIVVWQGYVDAMAETAVSDQLRIPQWPFKMLVAVGGLLLWMEFALDLYEKIQRLTGRQP